MNKINSSLIMDENKRKQVENESSRIYNLIRHNLKQEKGQRIFRPFWNDNLFATNGQEDGCEIFVGRLPRDAFEGELIPLFGRFGQIYESRLMMDFSGFTRGFCYVTYTHQEMAEFAVKQLHGTRIRPYGEKICCYMSLDNKFLFLEGLPMDKSSVEIQRVIMNALPDVERVILYADSRKDRLNLGVAFVEFGKHCSAANCRKYLWPARLNLWNSAISVEWAIPLPKYTENNVLLIKNVNSNMTRPEFNKKIAERLSWNVHIIYISQRSNYAVIQFHLKKDALLAFQLLNGHVIGGRILEAKLFEMTEQGEAQMMLEIQRYESTLYTANFLTRNRNESNYNRPSHSRQETFNLSCTILDQYIPSNNIPRSTMIGPHGLNTADYGLINYWNNMMVPAPSALYPSFPSYGIVSPIIFYKPF